MRLETEDGFVVVNSMVDLEHELRSDIKIWSYKSEPSLACYSVDFVTEDFKEVSLFYCTSFRLSLCGLYVSFNSYDTDLKRHQGHVLPINKLKDTLSKEVFSPYEELESIIDTFKRLTKDKERI